jgi:steroid delta-isomerase-like uncharacterized protein
MPAAKKTATKRATKTATKTVRKSAAKSATRTATKSTRKTTAAKRPVRRPTAAAPTVAETPPSVGPGSGSSASILGAPVDIARAIFAEVDAHDPDGVVAHNAEDCADDFVAVGEFHGRAAIRALFAEMFAAVPDFSIKPVLIVGDETRAVVQWRATGRFTGSAFQGITATGRQIDLKGVDVMEFEGGQLVRNTIYYDGATFARQIGLLPPQGSRADRAMLSAFNAKTKLLRRSGR